MERTRGAGYSVLCVHADSCVELEVCGVEWCVGAPKALPAPAVLCRVKHPACKCICVTVLAEWRESDAAPRPSPAACWVVTMVLVTPLVFWNKCKSGAPPVRPVAASASC